jgi:hypothetical protein
MSKNSSGVKKAVMQAISPTPEVEAGVDMENIKKTLLENTWDDIQNLYTDVAMTLANVGTSFVELMRIVVNSEISEYIPVDERRECDILANGFARDIQNLTTQALDNHTQHKGKTGPLASEDETFFSIDIFNNYIIINDQMTSLLLPIVARVTEIVGTASETRISVLSAVPESVH